MVSQELIERISSEYAYMDDLSLEGHLWEAIRRNKDYKNFCKEYVENEAYYDEIDTSVIDTQTADRLAVNGHPIDHYRRYARKLQPFFLKYPLEPSLKASDAFFSQHPLKGFFSHPALSDDLLSSPLYVREFQLIDFYDEWRSIHENALEVNIDLQAPLHEGIIKELKALVAQLRKKRGVISPDRKEGRGHLTDWKNHFMAHDLRNNYSIKDVGSIIWPRLEHMEPHASNCSLCKRVRKSIKRAKDLINGGYRKLFV